MYILSVNMNTYFTKVMFSSSLLIGQMSQNSGSYVGALRLFSFTLFLVFLIGISNLVFTSLQKLVHKRTDKSKNTTKSELQEPNMSHQEIISTWL